jgi:dipeptidyl-peptidase-3
MAAQDSALADRVGNTGFVQLTAESFHKLTPREQALAYWLSQASIAADPIIYDQLSRFGLRQKRLLETVVRHPRGVQPDVMKKIVDFTKLFWANKGNHNEMTSQKFLPEFTSEEFKAAAGPKLATEVDALKASLFDSDFEPMITAKSPRGKLDILQASSNNFYSAGLSLADIQGFHEQYPLNSRLAKGPDGKLVEKVYRAGTPDGKTPPDSTRNICARLTTRWKRRARMPVRRKPRRLGRSFASIRLETRRIGSSSASTGCRTTRR